ncbi:hypothetical protein AA0117_g13529 [Alternaria alternata]|uniref:Uncharacterized protein n=1 Tax=Alternaria alternata TaxID=5599 RepID=A0A4Q4M994_ALTAL|nr:hypothetical protein AA0117_g13529 [Alternaria alternata]
MTNFFQLDPGVVNATLGNPSSINGSAVEAFRELIPANLVQDTEKCLARCNAQ